MKRRYLFLLLLSLVPTLASGAERVRPEEVGLSSERLSRLSEFALAEVEKGRIAGAVSLVARRGHIVYFESVGKADIEEGRAMQEDSIFRIASMTKPIVSLAVMMLHEEGRFLLDDPISRVKAEAFVPPVGPSAPPFSPSFSRAGFSPTFLTPNGFSPCRKCSGPTSSSIESSWQSSPGSPTKPFARWRRRRPTNPRPAPAWSLSSRLSARL